MSPLAEFFRRLFSSDFTPYAYCLREPPVVLPHAIADSLIAFSYFLIPAVLLYLVRRRRDLAFRWAYVLFGVFILACGATHFLGVVTLWLPVYRLEGVVKAITALASLGTAVLLVRLAPVAVAFSAPGRLNRETELRGMIEAIQDAIAIADDAGKIAWVNSQLETLFGYRKGELLGREIEILLPARFRAGQAEQRRGFFSDPRFGWLGEGLDLFALRWDGSEFPAEIRLRSMGASRDLFGLRGGNIPVETGPYPIPAAQGQFVVASVIDITERKRAYAELQSRAAEMERLTYTVSHDLKSPLITIKSYVAMIGHDIAAGDTGRACADLDRIARAADKMYRRLEDLLALSRVGRVQNAPEKILFGSLVEEALELAEGGIHERHVRVEVAHDLPSVTVDRHRMVEVLQNLIDNASKFMGGQAEPEIRIGASNEGTETRFFVKDNGAGVEPGHHERIFRLFDKLDPKSGGSGAGLAIVKRIIETHGGRIWIESPGSGGGSTFWFTLREPEGSPVGEK